MPADDFAPHLDRDHLDLAALTPERLSRGNVTHHGARDDRQAARRQSGRDHASRAAGSRGGRSYAFRRS